MSWQIIDPRFIPLIILHYKMRWVFFLRGQKLGLVPIPSKSWYLFWSKCHDLDWFST